VFSFAMAIRNVHCDTDDATILDGIALAFAAQAILHIPTHFLVALSVLSFVVCHIRAPCFNRVIDLHAIWRNLMLYRGS